MNILTAAGIAQINEPIFPQNGERIFGGLGAVYFNQASQYGDPDNPSDPNAPINPPNCPNCGGGVEAPCNNCVTLAEAAETIATPCCISGGQDCETGENLPICLSGNCGGGEGEKGCNPPPPPTESCETVVITYYKATGMATPSETVYLVSTIDSASSDLESAIQDSVDSIISVCGGGSVVFDRTQSPTLSCNGVSKQITYTNYRQIQTDSCGQHAAQCNLIRNPTVGQYNLGLANWKKTKGKVFKNGKFEDICGSEEPTDDFTVCDRNGNQYKISTDSSGKPKVTPIT